MNSYDAAKKTLDSPVEHDEMQKALVHAVLAIADALKGDDMSELDRMRSRLTQAYAKIDRLEKV